MEAVPYDDTEAHLSASGISNSPRMLQAQSMKKKMRNAAIKRALKRILPDGFLKSLAGETIGTCFQTFLSFWGIWGTWVYFFNSVWWQFLNPFNLGLDAYAILVIFFFALIFVAIAPIMNCLGYCYRDLSCFYACCCKEDSPKERFLSLSWVFLGPVPAFLILLTLIDQPKARTMFAMLALTFGLLGQLGILVAPPDNRQTCRGPFCVTAGLLLLLVWRQGFSSATPMFDDPGGSGAWRYIIAKVLGAVLAVIASMYLCGEQDISDEADDETTHAVADQSKSGNCCSSCCSSPWRWLVQGPLLAAAFTLSNLYYNNLGAGPIYVGEQPFPLGVAVFFCVAVGCLIPLGDSGSGSEDPSTSAARPMEIPGWAPYLCGVLMLGAGLTSPGHHVAGICVMGLALPGLWTLAWRAVAADSAGYGFGIGFAALLMVLHYLLYLGVEFYDLVPVIGPTVGGNDNLFLWIVVAPAAAAVLLPKALQLCGCLPTPARSRTPFTPLGLLRNLPLPRLLVLGALVLMFVVVASVVASEPYHQDGFSSGASTRTPVEFSVMSYNNQASYDTSGRFNGLCMVRWLEAYKASYVSMPEGESMKLNLANRLATEYYQSRLGYKSVTYGAAGFMNSIGPSTLSSFAFRTTEFVLLPKPKADGSSGGTGINRYMTVHTVNLSPAIVAVLCSVHLEWFGDPTVQTKFIADYFLAHPTYRGLPIIIAGDFNLEPSGGNKAAPTATAWNSLISSGFRSGTGNFACKPGTMGNVNGHLCESDYSTANVAKGCSFPCIGYQLDWVIYRNPSAAEFTTAKSLNPEFVSRGSLSWKSVKSNLGAVSGDVSDSFAKEQKSKAFCSDHSPIMTTFEAAAV